MADQYRDFAPLSITEDILHGDTELENWLCEHPGADINRLSVGGWGHPILIWTSDGIITPAKVDIARFLLARGAAGRRHYRHGQAYSVTLRRSRSRQRCASDGIVVAERWGQRPRSNKTPQNNPNRFHCRRVGYYCTHAVAPASFDGNSLGHLRALTSCGGAARQHRYGRDAPIWPPNTEA